MKLSFVIPAYNEEAFIGKCLDSVLRELATTQEKIEVIVVNNASTDKTKEIALSFPSVIVVDQPQKGLTKARQAGFERSTGELIANVDSDNILPAGWLKQVLKEFDRNPELVALSGPDIFYDLPAVTSFLIRIFYWIGYLSNKINQLLKMGSVVQGGNFILRRTALEKIGGFDTSIDFYGEDTDIARRIVKVGKVKFTFDLPIYTSSRRLKEEGILRMAFKYAANYFWTTAFKKPLTKQHIDIRNK